MARPGANPVVSDTKKIDVLVQVPAFESRDSSFVDFTIEKNAVTRFYISR